MLKELYFMARTRRQLRHAILLSTSLAPMPILAQEVPADGPVKAASQDEALEIVVTAQRREQSLADVPISITALSGDTLRRQSAQTFVDYLDSIPNVSLIDSGTTGDRGAGSNVGIRGVAPGFLRPTVGFYLDDVPLRSGDPNLFDISRVEVLRGPQGTLYGRATLAGAIKIVTNEPDLDEVSGAVDGTLSGTHSGGLNWRVQSFLNIPIVTNKLALRVVGTVGRDNGYVDRVAPGNAALQIPVGPQADALARENVNNANVQSFRGSLKAALTDDFTIIARAYYQRDQVDARPTFDPDFGNLVQIRELETPERRTVQLYSLSLNYDFGDVKLASSTGYLLNNFRGVEDISRTARAGVLAGVPEEFVPEVLPALLGITTPYNISSRQREFSQELRLSGSHADKFNWIIGLFYTNSNDSSTRLGVSPGLNSVLGVLGVDPIFGEITAENTLSSKESEFGAFVDASYKITDQFEVSLGGRYYKFSADINQRARGLFLGPTDGTFFTLPTASAKNDGFVPKARVSYKPSENVLIYASAAQGFRLGGADFVIPDTPACRTELRPYGLTPPLSPSYGADTLWSYEIGGKIEPSRSLSISAAAFFIDWSNIQQSINLIQCGAGLTRNTGRAQSKGFELEVRSRPVFGLTLSGGVGFADATVRAADLTTGQQPGDSLIDSPKWQLNGSVQYDFKVTKGLTAFARADGRYLTRRRVDYTSGPADRFRNGYGTLNMRFGLEAGAWSAAVFATNLTNERPILRIDTFGTVDRQAYTIEPRTIGVNASYRF